MTNIIPPIMIQHFRLTDNPINLRWFDICKCGDYRHEHGADKRCKSWAKDGSTFQVDIGATEIPELYQLAPELLLSNLGLLINVPVQ